MVLAPSGLSGETRSTRPGTADAGFRSLVHGPRQLGRPRDLRSTPCAAVTRPMQMKPVFACTWIRSRPRFSERWVLAHVCVAAATWVVLGGETRASPPSSIIIAMLMVQACRPA